MSMNASSSTSQIYRDYGTLNLNVSVDYAQLEPARAAIAEMLNGLYNDADQDIVDRARQPLLEGYDNMLKSLGGWMSLADRAQSQADRLDRYFAAPDILRAFNAEDIRAAASQYLAKDSAVEILVVPESIDSAESAE